MVIENGGDHKECGVHAFSSLIHLFRKWSSLDHLCLAHKRLVCWSKFSDLLFLFLQSCDDVMFVYQQVKEHILNFSLRLT